MKSARWRLAVVAVGVIAAAAAGAKAFDSRPSASLQGQKPMASSQEPPARAAGADLFADWPAGRSPAEIGRRVAENFADRPFERPKAFIIYPEVCTWYGALTLADLTRNRALQGRLVHKFDPLLTPEGSKNISPNAHVDYRVFGAVPLEIFMQTATPGSWTSVAASPTGNGRRRRPTGSRPKRGTGSTTCS